MRLFTVARSNGGASPGGNRSASGAINVILSPSKIPRLLARSEVRALLQDFGRDRVAVRWRQGLSSFAKDVEKGFRLDSSSDRATEESFDGTDDDVLALVDVGLKCGIGLKLREDLRGLQGIDGLGIGDIDDEMGLHRQHTLTNRVVEPVHDSDDDHERHHADTDSRDREPCDGPHETSRAAAQKVVFEDIPGEIHGTNFTRR
jgi:hypothetical protein